MARRRKASPDTEHAYYYNTKTDEVEYGMLSAFTYRLGPYPTRHAAEHAMELAQERNEAWEIENREWRDDWGEEEDEE